MRVQVNIYLFCSRENEWERLTLEKEDPMPHMSTGLTVQTFCACSRTELVWSDDRAITALDRLLQAAPVPLQVTYAFRRGFEHSHAGQSHHMAGLASDLTGPDLARHRGELTALALECGFHRVEAVCQTPLWLHVQVDLPGGAGKGYPTLTLGSKGVHVLVAQEALGAVGVYPGALTGVFCPQTEQAVRRFRAQQSLSGEPMLDGALWEQLMHRAQKKRRAANAARPGGIS